MEWNGEESGSRSEEGGGLSVLRMNTPEQQRVGKKEKRCAEAGFRWDVW